MDVFYSFFNWLIEGIGVSLAWVLDFLPDSPIGQFNNDSPTNVILGHITYFIPFPTMILHFSVIITCIATYYMFRVVARWLKLVRGG